MERVLGRIAPYCYALMRIVMGLLFACHGAQKLFGLFGARAFPLTSQMGLAGIIELVCGLMIAAGFFTGIAAIVAAGEMGYAYVTVHSRSGPWPIRNGGELALLYLVAFLYIATRGSGAWGATKGGSRK